MIIDPSLIGHWKFKTLCREIGTAEAFRALHLLWGCAQEQKQWIFRIGPKKLAGTCDYEGDLEKFWAAMTDPECGWLVPRGGGWWEIRNWEKLNRTLIQAWTTKTKGRLPWMKEFEADVPGQEDIPPPPAASPLPEAVAAVAVGEAEAEVAGAWDAVVADRSGDRSADASPDRPGDRSYDGWRREEERKRKKESECEKRREREGQGRREGEQELSKSSKAGTHTPLCTLDEALEFSGKMGMSREGAKVWWHLRNSVGWMRTGL